MSSMTTKHFGMAVSLLVLVLTFLSSAAVAFTTLPSHCAHHGEQSITNRVNNRKATNPETNPYPMSAPVTRSVPGPQRRSPTVLAAKNKKSGSNSKAPAKKDTTSNVVRTKIDNPAELVLLYMTPWKNPNSIFVYLFLAVFLLGKYSESQSALR